MEDLARVQLHQTGSEYYQLFVNALSFTLAVTSVDEYVTSDQNELITLAFTLALVAALLLIVENQLMAWYEQLPVRKSGGSIAEMLSGPVGLLSYLLRTISRVMTHFLSTVIGRWVMTLRPGDLHIGDTSVVVCISISIVWLLGCSVGLVAFPHPSAVPPD